jgi:hypothetical protein
MYINQVLLVVLKEVDAGGALRLLDALHATLQPGPAPLPAPSPPSSYPTSQGEGPAAAAAAAAAAAGGGDGGGAARREAAFELVAAVFDTSKLGGLSSTVEVA